MEDLAIIINQGTGSAISRTHTKLEAQIKDVFWAKPLVGKGPCLVKLPCATQKRREEASRFFYVSDSPEFAAGLWK